MANAEARHRMNSMHNVIPSTLERSYRIHTRRIKTTAKQSELTRLVGQDDLPSTAAKLTYVTLRIRDIEGSMLLTIAIHPLIRLMKHLVSIVKTG